MAAFGYIYKMSQNNTYAQFSILKSQFFLARVRSTM